MTAPSSNPAPYLTPDQLTEMLTLIEGSDSVELKMTVDAGAQRSTLEKLGLDPLGAQIRLVHFFDTPDLKLQAAGVVVRARRSAGRDDDTVIKLRPVVPDELPKKLRKREDFKVEVDAMRGGFVCSGSFKGLAREPVRENRLGGRPLRKLYTKQQRAFYDEHAPEGVTLDDLIELGPIFVLKAKGSPEGFPHKLVVELWLYPDGDRILELSTKCLPAEGLERAAELRAYLRALGIEPSEGQQTKTAKALGFFSAQAAQAATADAA